MGRHWQLQEAKARLSEVVRAAQQDGPQEISIRGKPAVVVVSKRAFERLSGGKPSFVEFIRRSPLAGACLRIRRNRSPAREVTL